MSGDPGRHLAVVRPGRLRPAGRLATVGDVSNGPEQPTARGDQTRQRIVDAALRLFAERGYTRTTMRAVAAEAGVSLGNAYYYFGSKDQLVQGFYERMQAQHEAVLDQALAGSHGLGQRWERSELAFLDVAAPFHPFAGKFFAIAAEPTSPASPFSDESEPARRAAVDIVRRVVAGSDSRGDARLLAELPELLWLAHMGLVLFWVHDTSPEQHRTRTLVRRSAPLLEQLVALSRLRPLRRSLHDALDLVAALQGPDGPDGTPAGRA